MITQVVFYICNEGQREIFWHDIISEKIDKDGKEEIGNIHYSFFSSLENKNIILLVESWKDAQSLDCHYESETFKKLGVLKKKYVRQTIIENYTNNI
jgi:quinol monooxygenase YgiN